MNAKILKWGIVMAVIVFIFFWTIVFIENRPMTVENTNTPVAIVQTEKATSTTPSYLKGFIEKDSAFFVPESMAISTNLSRDSKISFETQNASSCDATIFAKDLGLPPNTKTQDIVIGTTTYSTLTFSDAGAGNFYETTIYSTKASSTCSALKLFIHSTNIGNYTPGTIKAFDKAKLLEIFAEVLQNFSIK